MTKRTFLNSPSRSFWGFERAFLVSHLSRFSSFSVGVASAMGVDDLRPSLESIFPRMVGSDPYPESKQIFAEGVPPDCSIALDDLMPQFHAFKQTDDMDVEEFIRIRISYAKNFFINSFARILWLNA